MRALLLLPLLVACTKLAPGEPCSATGEGFTRKDPCSFTCVEWEVPCDDGSAVEPGVCSSTACRTDGDCAVGYACALTGSVTRSCLPEDLCDAGFAQVAPTDDASEVPASPSSSTADLDSL